MQWSALYCAGMFSALLLRPWLPDLSYFIRNWLLNVGVNKDKKLADFSDSSSVVYDGCRVLPEDIDRNLHMSNDKYLYHLNFARKYYFCCHGVWEYLWERNCNMVVTCQSIRYRRELHLWQSYKISVRMVGWSDVDKSFYLESAFVANSGDNDQHFIHAVHWTKYRLLFDKKSNLANEDTLVPTAVLSSCGLIDKKIVNELETVEADDIRLWIEANAVSSQKLRRNLKTRL